MKKLLIGSFALILTTSAFAQNGKVISAYNYLSEYNSSGKDDNLVSAAKNIDMAIADESTSGLTKTWWYRSQIYQSISSDTALTSQYPKASLEAVKSFQKMKDIADPKFKDWSDAYTNMNAICNNVFNDGVTAFNKKAYHDAYLFFYAVSDVQDILVAKGQVPSNAKLLTNALANAGLCAENDSDYVNALTIYKKLITISPDVKAYLSLISVMKKQKDIEGSKKVIDEALAKYPSNQDLLIAKINSYNGKYADAIAYLQKASEQEPKNEQIQAALGSAYEDTNDTVKARQIYENILVLNPNNFEANFRIGAMIFNRTKPIQEKINSLGISVEDTKLNDALTIQRNAIFMQAKPYLERANAVHPNDSEVKKALNTIEAKTRK